MEKGKRGNGERGLILLRGCEGEMCCYLFATFVVLIVDQFVVRDDGPLEQQRQDSHVC